MATITALDTLPQHVRSALSKLQRCGNQSLIKVGETACQVEWAPDTYCHHSMVLPVMFLMAAIDEGAARCRWRDMDVVAAVSSASVLDNTQKAVLLALAGPRSHDDFAVELRDWVDEHNLADRVFQIDRRLLESGGAHAHYGVTPAIVMHQIVPCLKLLEHSAQLAAVAVLGLYNGLDARDAFKSKRLARLNPPVLEAFHATRAHKGEGACSSLLRLIALYHGW